MVCAAVGGAEPKGGFVVIAHRGNHEAAHENTVEAIRAAVAAGVDYVEIDVRRTRDGRHVLMHDRSVTRMTGATGLVEQLSYQEIRRLEVRDAQRPALRASGIPTLEEALKALGGETGLYLDFKAGVPRVVVETLQSQGLVDRTVVYLSPDRVAEWRRLDGRLRFIVSLPDSARSPAGVVGFLAKHPGVILDGPVTDYTVELVEAAHAAGARVWPDIQNLAEHPDQWEAALRLGVDGLQTDRPSAMVDYLRRRLRRGAPEGVVVISEVAVGKNWRLVGRKSSPQASSRAGH